MSYQARQIKVEFTLEDGGTFDGRGNILALENGRCFASIAAYSGMAGTELTLQVWGLSVPHMAALSARGVWIKGIPQNHLRAWAGGHLIFEGFITDAYTDYNQLPDVPMVVTANMQFYLRAQEVAPFSASGDVQVADIIRSMACRTAVQKPANPSKPLSSIKLKPAPAGFVFSGVAIMQTRSLLLDTETWDITLDDSGNLATTDNPYAVAQDVACACSVFQGECWYDSSLGIPYYSRILGHWPGTQLINVRMQQEAMKLSYVASAVCSAVSDRQRGITGVMMITDTNNVNSAVGL